MSTSYYDAAIIGAGIAGIALAKRLADQGWKVLLLERKTFPKHKVCGEFLSPEAAAMLKSLGVLELVEAQQPSIIRQAKIITRHGHSLDIPLPGHATGISRYCLDTVLLQAALQSGVEVWTAAAATAVAPSGTGYHVELKRGKQTDIIEARTVIAAWGVNGQLKQHESKEKSGISRPVSNRNPSYIGVKTHLQALKADSTVELYFFEGGYLGLSPVEGGLTNAAALIKPDAFSVKPKSVEGWIQAACSRNASLKARLADAELVPDTQAAVAPVQLQRKPLVWDAYPHVGDAALMIPPLCGDGMSMALRSALLCAPLADCYLRGELTLARWRAEYERMIAIQFNRPRQWGRLLQWMAAAPLLPQLLLPAVKLAPFIARRLVLATRLKDNTDIAYK